MALNPGFWAGRRVFVTGHTGFKGSWLSLWLQKLGADVAGYALHPSTVPNLFEVGNVAGGMRSAIADVRDAEGLLRALSAARPEIVIHMAAQALVRESYRSPVETYATNLLGTVHALEAVRSVPGIRVVVVVTSDKCYQDNGTGTPHDESAPLGGKDPYSSSKACAELATQAYRTSFFANTDTAIATARAGNVIGGGDWAPDRLVPDAVRAWTAGESLLVRYPRAVRPWQHVLEPLSGYLVLAERLWNEGAAHAEAWNFGPGDDDSREVQWVVDRLVQLWGAPARWESDARAAPHETHALRLDCGKAMTRLNWSPQLGLDEALEWTTAWYRQYSRGRDVAALTRQQIRDYQARIT